MEVITSKNNETIKRIKLLKEKKYRDKENEYLIEGIKLVKEAILENKKIKKIIINKDVKDIFLQDEMLKKVIENNDVLECTENVFKLISDVETPQGIVAVLEKENIKDIDYKSSFILALDTINDPRKSWNNI